MSSPTQGSAFQGDPRELGHGGPADLRPRVLCVDDELPALSTLARVLQPRFEVVTCQDPVAALALLEGDGDFAVVLADVNMPQLAGLEFLAKVREQSPLTTRLALTGVSGLDPAALPRGLVFRVLVKPCPLETLTEALSDAVTYRALHAASPFQPVESPRHELWPSELEGLATPDSSRERSPSSSGDAAAPAVLIRYAELGVGWPSAEAHRIGLRLVGRTVELLPGVTLLGRSRSCHIPIDDRKVSRRHACFDNHDQQLTVRNLSSTNPLLLNGKRLDGEPHPLAVGDRLTVCGHEIEVCTLRDYRPSLEPTERVSELPIAGQPCEELPVTLGMLASVAAKYLRLGQHQDAERILRPVLQGLLRHCRIGQAPLDKDLDLAVDFALDLAEANRSGEWLSYLFELLAAVEQPAGHAALERLYRIVPVTPGVSMTSYRRLVDVLQRGAERQGPARQFLIRRLQGLETALLRSAHL